MARLPIGQLIRDRRRDMGMTQGALAAAVGVSPSYLSLIENDNRSIGGALVKRIASTLQVDLDRLTGHDNERLAQDLVEVVRSHTMTGLDEHGAYELAVRSPEWAAAFRNLHRRYLDAHDTALALSDRLSRDRQMMDLSYSVLTQITSIQAFAEILIDYPDLDPEDRQRFGNIVAAQSNRLGSDARDLMAMLDSGPNAPRPTSPMNEVEDFIIYRRNHFPELEAAADRLRVGVGDPSLVALTGCLERDHGIRAVAAPGRDGESELVLPRNLPETSRRFRAAMRLAEVALADLLDDLVKDQRLTGQEARELGRQALTRYAAGALLLPYDRLLETATAVRYDIDLLRAQFGASFEQIAHRLVTLRRPGAEGIPFAFLRVDPAGNLSKPFSIPGLRMPRLGGACPLWAIYQALSVPDRPVAQFVEMPEGERFLFIARRLSKRASAYAAPAPVYSVMLACEALHAQRTVYGDAFAADRASLVTQAGYNCRSCPREGCEHRAHRAVLPATPTAPGPAA